MWNDRFRIFIRPLLADRRPLEARRAPTFIKRGLLGTTLGEASLLVPGLLLSVAIVAVALSISDLADNASAYQGIASFILIAIVLGILLRNTAGVPALFTPGIGFAIDKLLKLGIILMGVRLSFSNVMTIGIWSLPIIVCAVAIGLVAAIYLIRFLKLPGRMGTLMAIGTSICGTSAVLAAAPGIKATDSEVAYTVANITVLGIVAMFAYPYLAEVLFERDVLNVGLFLGTSIHNTAQVAGAGLVYDQSFSTSGNTSVTDVAIITKLVRNLMMVGVIPLMAFLYARRAAQEGVAPERGQMSIWRLLPVFIVGFLVMAALRSVGDVGLDNGGLAIGLWGEDSWTSITDGIKTWAEYVLGTAMAAVGLSTAFGMLKALGPKPFVVGLATTVVVGVAAVVLVLLLGPLATIE